MALKTEPKDRVWASSTENQVRLAVDTAVKEGAKFSVKTLNCMTSLCEMVLSAASAEDLQYISHQLPSHVTGMGSLDLAPPEIGVDGTATVTCRLFRQGYSRPDEWI